MIGCIDGHRCQAPDVIVRVQNVRSREVQPGSLNSGRLPGHSDDAQAVGAVRGEVEFQYRVREGQGGVHRGPDRQIPLQHHDARGVYPQGQLRGAAEHALGTLAPDQAGRNHRSVRHAGSRQRHRRQKTGRGIGCAADHRNDAAARIDLADREPVGGRVWMYG